ncbi:hypothetical protein [Arsenicicoccus bolidensis]|uniref:hypothetical protein n=1 Tax=Arsenicicoccus bolidensis TaxID=229480 RepID=UPI0012EBEA4A|nr:hypothetical protein [Arsenicicoccus bolidensis]
MIFLSSCNTSAPAPSDAPSTSADGGIVVPIGVSSARPGVEVQNDDGTVQNPATETPLVLDLADKDNAEQTALKVMRFFARRNVSAEQWWADLAPLMTVQAQQAYRDTDPRNVPPTKVTGAAKVTPSSRPQVARVSVPTDVGSYLVILGRTPQDPTWRADRILPPENIEQQ